MRDGLLDRRADRLELSGRSLATSDVRATFLGAFAKLKALLRKTVACTVGDLTSAVGAAIDTFMPAECANYFAAAGYDAN